MTADPRYVAEARSIEQLSYNEAMEISHFGAKVIFPNYVQPAMAVERPLGKKHIQPNAQGDNGHQQGIRK